MADSILDGAREFAGCGGLRDDASLVSVRRIDVSLDYREEHAGTLKSGSATP
jgi:hypothetical protein